MQITKSMTLVSKNDVDTTVTIDDVNAGIYELSNGEVLTQEQLLSNYEILPEPMFNISMPEVQQQTMHADATVYTFDSAQHQLNANDIPQHTQSMQPNVNTNRHMLQDAFSKLNSEELDKSKALDTTINIKLTKELMTLDKIYAFADLFNVSKQDMLTIIIAELSTRLDYAKILQLVASNIMSQAMTTNSSAINM